MVEGVGKGARVAVRRRGVVGEGRAARGSNFAPVCVEPAFFEQRF